MPFKDRPPLYLVWNPSTGKTFYRHKTLDGAKTEAQKLSDEHGGKFHVLMSLGRCTPDKDQPEKKSTTLTLKKKIVK